MDRFIDRFLHEKMADQNPIKTMDCFFFIMITLVAFIARISVLEHLSGDYVSFLEPWFNELKAAGGLGGLGLSIGDYTPAYMYILALLTYIPVDSLVSIKLVSCLFDFALAISVMCFCYRETKKISISIALYGLFLFLPTVLINSAMWAQCDIIFALFCVLSVFQYIKGRSLSGMVFFSIALCFKLQAIFILPLIVLLWLKKRGKLWHFAMIPAVYIISILPAFFMGRPLGELLTIYFSQAGQYGRMSLNAPNFYLWVGTNAKLASAAAICICFFVVMLILYFAYRASFELNSYTILNFAFLFVLIMPFLLPHMHERYFFLADIFALLYVIKRPRRILVAAAIWLCSILCYSPFIFGSEPISVQLTPIIMLIAIALVTSDTIKLMYKKDWHMLIAQ